MDAVDTLFGRGLLHEEVEHTLLRLVALGLPLALLVLLYAREERLVPHDAFEDESPILLIHAVFNR